MSQEFDLVIHSGTLVMSGDTCRADLGVRAGRIAAIGHALQGHTRLDATGKLVLPGAIDPHVHLEMSTGQTVSSDDWITGTVAAAHGGVTTVIDFIEPEPDEPLADALAVRRGQAEGRAVIDYGLHMTLARSDAQTLAQIPAMVAGGTTSFKVYTTYGFRLNDDQLLPAFKAVGQAGGLILAHAENHAMVEWLRRELLATGCTAPRDHPRSRPAAVEAEAIERVLALAEVAHAPLYVVHTSTGRGAAAIARAQARGQAAFGETCPQYLVLTEAEYDRPGFEGAKFVCSPPLRSAADNAALWAALAAGTVQTVGTDHCPFNYRGQKDIARRPDGTLPPFMEIPGGIPGIEARLALLYTFGVRAGHLSLNQWVDVCSTNPARIFGLSGRKGTLLPGADADIVIFDPDKTVTLSRAMLHERVDYTPYEGLALQGYPVTTIAQGEILVHDGQFIGPRGRGQFLKRDGIK